MATKNSCVQSRGKKGIHADWAEKNADIKFSARGLPRGDLVNMCVAVDLFAELVVN